MRSIRVTSSDAFAVSQAHAQCAVDSLQYNRRCPICRHEETIVPATDDDLYDEGYIARCENIVHGRLKQKLSAAKMRTLLKDFDVPDATLRKATKRSLADMLAEQMLYYETDDDDDDDDADDGEEIAEEDDIVD